MKKKSFAYYWILIYAFALILCPPLKIGSKNVFLVELLLFPLLLKLGYALVKGKAKAPPRPLILVWVALLLAFISGLWRQELAKELSLYLTYFYPPEGDQFRLTTDLTRYVRWTLMFSTPWIIQQTLSAKTLPTFLRAIYVLVFISACLALFEMGGYINLAPYYGYVRNDFWGTRSYGTAQSPLEASLIYGGVLILLLLNPHNLLKTKSTIYFIAAITYALALIATFGATAFVATAVCIVLWKIKSSSYMKNVFSVLPFNFLSLKQANFLTRFELWGKWLAVVPAHPWIVIFGMGFTSLVSDNSLFLMVMYGGFFLLISFLWWLKTCFVKVPAEFKIFFIFWFISWITLDSVGFWGIGRLAWLLFGFFL
ncbi:MAG: hypothetical protein SGI74_09495 [Oligoflexia bacterium]|nr:hypothetical protein [Oligoflexia bacterium]